MFRGTTPTLTFNLSMPVANISEAFVTLMQNHKIIVQKTGKNVTARGSAISCKLTQQETLMLSTSFPLEIQLRIKMTDGTALASEIFTVQVGRILRDGEI